MQRLLTVLTLSLALLGTGAAVAVADVFVGDELGNLMALALFAVVLIPLSVATFSAAERWAKRTGRLKRQG